MERLDTSLLAFGPLSTLMVLSVSLELTDCFDRGERREKPDMRFAFEDKGVRALELTERRA